MSEVGTHTMVGTVTMDVAKAVKDAKAGRVEYRVDKAGNIHCPVGRRSFAKEALVENVTAVLRELNRARPAAAKGIFIKRVTVTSSMGPGLHVAVRDAAPVFVPAPRLRPRRAMRSKSTSTDACR
mgnify:CR=1 FL=1